MSIPTVAVTCIAYDQNGNPVAGGLFRARLNRTEIYNGFVVSEQVTGTADANGVVVLQLWPNALGVAGSSYRITAINPDTRQQYLNTTAVVPNSACNLHEIIVAAPYPEIDASEQALIAAQGALALVTAQAGIATAAATEAEGFADDAQTSATAAEASAIDASNSFTDFDKRYLGTKGSDPIVDNEGNALQIGALYYLLERGLRIYDGATWAAAYISEAGTLTNSDIGITVQAYSENLDDFAAKTAPAGDVVGTTDIQTLSAKSISGTDNTLTNIANSSLVNSAVTVNGQTVALGASTTITATATNPLTIGTGLNGASYNGSAPVTVSLANTTVTPASYGSASDTLTATVNARGQLTALAATPIAIANTQVSGLGTASVLDAAVALGAATLDAGGKVPLSQIPASIQGGVSYQGTWDATTNTPTIVSSTGSKGHYYVVSVAGTTTINGISDWLPGDWIIFNGTAWEKIDNTDSVTSVNGYIGAVSLNAADVGAPPTTRTITAGTGLTGGGDLSANRTIEIDSTVATLTGTQTLTNKTFGDNPTLSGGTANGVTYLNGSKVLTSGSALTFDGNKLLVSSSGEQVKLLSSGDFTTTGTGYIRWYDSVGAKGYIGYAGTANQFDLQTGTGMNLNFNAVGGTTTFAVSNSEQMRLTSAGLGIGTSSPTSKLDVNGDVTQRNGSGTIIGSIINNAGWYEIAGSANVNGLQVAHVSTQRWMLSDSEQMRLTSAGLGIGTSSPGAKLDVKGGTTISTLAGWNTLSNSMFELANPAVRFGIGYDSSDQVLLQAFDSSNAARSLALQVYGGNVGIGTSSPSGKLEVVGNGQVLKANTNTTTSTSVAFQLGGLGTTSNSGSFIRSYVNLGSTLNSQLAFEVNGGTEVMRLDASGSVGIGTSSPSQKLTVLVADAAQSTSFQSATGRIRFRPYVDASNGAIIDSTNTAESAYLPLSLTGSVVRLSTGTGYATLDASGNLGLGVTPSASQIPQLQISRGTFTGDINSSYVSNNWYYNSGDKYIGTNYALQYKQAALTGEHQWYTAPSGTAGNAISFTQAMTLDASGNLALGTTSFASQARLQVAGGRSYFGSNDSVYAVHIAFNNTRAQTGQGYYIGATDSATPSLVFSNNDGTERARITSDGSLLVGTTSSSISNTAGSRFIDSGRTLNIVNTGAVYPSIITNQVGYGGITISFRYTNAEIGYISTSSTSVAYVTSSDYRLKNTIAPMTGALAKVALLKPCTYKWNADGSDGEGFIAHELAEVVPSCVTGEKDAVDAEGNPKYQGIDTSFLVATLTAAIQEQQAIIESLKARLDAANI